MQILGVGSETIHLTGEILIAANLETTALLQSLSLLELLVVGAEEHGHIPYGSLQQVVDTHAKASTHVGHVAIVVDARQQAEAVDDQDIGVLRVLRVFRKAGIADDLATFEKLLYLLQMILADDMRGDDELPLRVLVEIFNKYLLVGRP